MFVWRAILSYWRRYQRQTDIELLWPAIVADTPDLNHAKAVFAAHAFLDPAWTREMSELDIINFINRMEP